MALKEEAQRKKNYKLGTLKELRIVLHDISDIIPPHQKLLLEEKKKQIKQRSLCINTHKNSSSRVQAAKQNIQKTNDVKRKRSVITSSFKNVAKKGNKKKCETIEAQLNGKDVEPNKNILQHNNDDIFKPSKRRSRLISDSRDESFSSKQDDQTSSIESLHVPKIVVPTSTKKLHLDGKPSVRKKNRLNSSEDILYCSKSDITGTNVGLLKVGSDDTNCLDKKNLTFIDCNSKIQEVSSESIVHRQYNNNLHLIDVTGTNYKLRLRQHKKNQDKKVGSSNVTNTDLKNNFYINKTPENIKIDSEKDENSYFSDNLLITFNNKINRKQDEQDLRTKLSYGTTSLAINTTVQETKFSVDTEKDFVAQSSIKPALNKSATIRQTLPKITQDCHLPKGTIKINKQTIKANSLENNSFEQIYLELNKYDDSNKDTKQTSHIDDTFIPIKDGKEDNTPEIREMPDGILKIPECTLKRKCTVKGNSEDFSQDNKRVKLNRKSWLLNNATSIISKNQLKSNDFTNIDTSVMIKSNVTASDVEDNHVETVDLRQCLNIKKLEEAYNLETISKSNKNLDRTVYKDINLNHKNDIAINAVENKGICNKLFLKEELTFNGVLYEEKSNAQVNPAHNNDLNLLSKSQNTLEKIKHTNQINTNTHKDINIKKKYTDDIIDRESDDDYISLFAEESFDISENGDTILYEKEKPYKSLHSDKPYIMSTSSFNKYMKQNTSEFNKEYTEYLGNRTEKLNRSKETKEAIKKTKEVTNKQEKRTLHADNVAITATKLIPPLIENIGMFLKDRQRMIRFNGYCFATLKENNCRRLHCSFNHDLQRLTEMVYSKDSSTILMITKVALDQEYYFFCQKIYIASLQKLDITQILEIYKMLHDNHNLEKKVIRNIIEELLRREMPLKTIVDNLVASILPVKDSIELKNILMCVETYIKPGEYWDSVRRIILLLQPNKYMIEKILRDCINNENSLNIEDINNVLINKLHPIIMSTLSKSLIARFQNLLTKKTVRDPRRAASVQEFGETSVLTIASPGSSPQAGFPKRCNIISTNSTDIEKIKTYVVPDENVTDNMPYKLQIIDNLPEDNLINARSFYKDHVHLWKFYVDLDRFTRGLKHEDYDYVIDILESYAEKQDESLLFVRSCCSILRTEVKRSEYHLANVIHRTVQTGTSSILGKILFDIGLDVLASLVDKEAWGLAMWFIQTLKIYDMSHNAGFMMLSAEIYLASKKTVKALDLLKYKNIIYTSRAKWHVKSIISDEYVRNKIIYILLDLLCNECTEHAFFLFQFLLRDQPSQYYPIDLTRYVDKLIILLLSKNDTSLITEMGGLILKYNFALNTTTCRALISTLIHMDNILARQLYNYAEALGIYPAMKLASVTHIIINTDSTEEEIYLIFLQLIEKLVINFGHTIEFIKPRQITIYLILEIKSPSEQLYCTELQSCYNSQAVTNIKTLIKNVLKKRFDPPILLTQGWKGRICKLQNKSLINYLKSEHCS